MINLPRWEIQAGLPPYGPMALPFSHTGMGTHREGFVVKFFPSTGTWIGNFQRGLSSLDHVFSHPNEKHAVIVAGGTAYVVDPDSRNLIESFGGQIDAIIPVPELRYVLIRNGVSFEAMGPTGIVWKSRRISWDGMRNISLLGSTVHGEAYRPEGVEVMWDAFELDILTGSVTGGSWAE